MPTIEFSSGGGSVVNGIAGAMQGALAAEQMLQQQRRLALLEQRDAFEQDLARRRFDFLERVDARDFAAQRSDVAFGQDLQRQALDLRRMGTEADIDLGRRRLDLAERQEGRLAGGQAAGLALDERRVGLAEDAAARDAAGAEGVRDALIDELVRRGDIPKSDIGVYQQLPPAAVATKFEFFEQARAQQRAVNQARTLIDLVFPQAQPAAPGEAGAQPAPDPAQQQIEATRQSLLEQLEADPEYAAVLAPQLLERYLAERQMEADIQRRAILAEAAKEQVDVLAREGIIPPQNVGRAKGMWDLIAAGIEGVTPQMAMQAAFADVDPTKQDPLVGAATRNVVNAFQDAETARSNYRAAKDLESELTGAPVELPDGTTITRAELEATAEAAGMTVEELLAALREQAGGGGGGEKPTEKKAPKMPQFRGAGGL